MKKPVSLTAHKSQIERTARKTIRTEMVGAAQAMASDHNILSYAIVGFDDEGRAFAAWDTGKIMPKWAFPAAVFRVLDRDCDMVEDDYKAPLRRTGWPK